MALKLDCLLPKDYDDRSCSEQRGGLECGTKELKNVYQERLPYTLKEQVQGLCVKYEEEFILLCRYAMSTDCMDNMNSQERELWRFFTYYEDDHSTSAGRSQCGGRAQAATDHITIEDPNTGTVYTGAFPLFYEDEKWGFYKTLENNKWVWKIMPKRPMVPQYCFQERAFEPEKAIPKAYVYDALDDIFHNIHECLPYNDCDCKDYELMVNDCNNPADPIGPEDIYKTGCGDDYQGCQIVIEQRNSRRRRK